MSDLLDFSPPGQATFSLAGAKARFYDAGTTNPRTVYADEAETIAHPSPLLADSSGRFAQAFVSGGAVKVVVTRSDDSTGYTLDPCVKVGATGSTASSVSFTPSVAIPETNVQDAIDFLQSDIAADFAAFSTGLVTLGALGRRAPVTKTADFTVAATENWLINNKSGSACVVTLPAAASFTGREIMIQNLQAQAVNSASSNVIPLGGGSAETAILAAVIGAWAVLVSNGTNWQIVQQGAFHRAAGAAASGTAIDFNIPAWASRVTLVFSVLQTNGTSVPILQLGDSGGIEATGYIGSGADRTGQALYTTGFGFASTWAATVIMSGRVELVLTNPAANTWVATGNGAQSDAAGWVMTGGSKSLSAPLDRIRLTTVGGVNTFTAGFVTATWE